MGLDLLLPGSAAVYFDARTRSIEPPWLAGFESRPLGPQECTHTVATWAVALSSQLKAATDEQSLAPDSLSER